MRFQKIQITVGIFMKNKKPDCVTIDETFLEELIETRQKTGVLISIQLEHLIKGYTIRKAKVKTI